MASDSRNFAKKVASTLAKKRAMSIDVLVSVNVYIAPSI